MSRHAAPRGRRARPRPAGARPGVERGAGVGVRAAVGRDTSPGVPVPPGRTDQVRAAGVAVAVGAGLAGGAAAGRTGVAVAVGLVQAGLVPAWILGTRRPGRVGGVLTGLAAAAAGDAALLARDRTSPAALLGVLALALPVLLAHQLTRGVIRVRVTESLAGIAFLVTAVAALSTPIALARAVDGPRLVAVVGLAAGAGLAAARLTDAAAPVPRIAAGLPYGLLALLTAAGAGAAAGAAAAGGPLSAAGGAGAGALVAAVAALAAVGTGFATAGLPAAPPRLAAAYLPVALPIALAAPVGYLVLLSVAG